MNKMKTSLPTERWLVQPSTARSSGADKTADPVSIPLLERQQQATGSATQLRHSYGGKGKGGRVHAPAVLLASDERRASSGERRASTHARQAHADQSGRFTARSLLPHCNPTTLGLLRVHWTTRRHGHLRGPGTRGASSRQPTAAAHPPLNTPPRASTTATAPFRRYRNTDTCRAQALASPR